VAGEDMSEVEFTTGGKNPFEVLDTSSIAEGSGTAPVELIATCPFMIVKHNNNKSERQYFFII
jgi:hypothetical protein